MIVHWIHGCMVVFVRTCSLVPMQALFQAFQCCERAEILGMRLVACLGMSMPFLFTVCCLLMLCFDWMLFSLPPSSLPPITASKWLCYGCTKSSVRLCLLPLPTYMCTYPAFPPAPLVGSLMGPPGNCWLISSACPPALLYMCVWCAQPVWYLTSLVPYMYCVHRGLMRRKFSSLSC